MENKDYYRILGVKRESTREEIRNAYRNLAFKYHPDRNADAAASVERMKAINEAYAVLSEPVKRREYDAIRQRYGKSARDAFRNQYSESDIFSGSDVHQVFEEMARSFGFRGVDEIFGDFYGRRYQTFTFRTTDTAGDAARGQGGHPNFATEIGKHDGVGWFGAMKRLLWFMRLPEVGADTEDAIVLSEALARRGGAYAYEHRRRKTRLVVQIPLGVREGQRIRLAGMGGVGRQRNGDLFLRVRIHMAVWVRLKRLGRHLVAWGKQKIQ